MVNEAPFLKASLRASTFPHDYHTLFLPKSMQIQGPVNNPTVFMMKLEPAEICL